MSLTSAYNEALRVVREKYSTEQKEFLTIIAQARGMPVEWLDGVGAIFIPNNEFMLSVFGKEVLDYDCYVNGKCVWNNAMIFPIRDVNDSIVGFGGFFPFEYVDEESNSNYYLYSSQKAMRKGNYLYFPQKNLMDAVKDGYLIVVDGVFDAISLTAAGYNAASLMGSSPTQQIMMQLRFIKTVILVADNDDAGYGLYDKLHKHLKNVVLFKQGKTKDVDDLLKSEYAGWFKRRMDTLILECRDGALVL